MILAFRMGPAAEADCVSIDIAQSASAAGPIRNARIMEFLLS